MFNKEMREILKESTSVATIASLAIIISMTPSAVKGSQIFYLLGGFLLFCFAVLNPLSMLWRKFEEFAMISFFFGMVALLPAIVLTFVTLF